MHFGIRFNNITHKAVFEHYRLTVMHSLSNEVHGRYQLRKIAISK